SRRPRRRRDTWQRRPPSRSCPQSNAAPAGSLRSSRAATSWHPSLSPLSDVSAISGDGALTLAARPHVERSPRDLAAAPQRHDQAERAGRAKNVALARTRALSFASVTGPWHRLEHGAGRKRHAGRQRCHGVASLQQAELAEHRLPAGGGLLLDAALPGD